MHQYQNLLIATDQGGCNFYRMQTPAWAVRSVMRNILFVESSKYVFDHNFYQGFTAIHVQRHVSDFHTKVVLEWLKLISTQVGAWLVYNVDDVILSKDIPKWNLAYKAYSNPNFANNIKKLMEASDFIVVTTIELAEYYSKELEIPIDNFIVIPNYLPRWWSNSYNLSQTMQNYSSFKRRPRIGITSSITHYDANQQNNNIDDFSDIEPFIRANCDRYEFCFISGIPPYLQDLAMERKITVYPGSDIFNFMREVHEKQFQVILAPLKDCVFNQCKSNIKLIEAWSLGIPVIAQDIIAYNKYTDLVFKDNNTLQNQLDRLLPNRSRYKDMVKSHRNLVDFGDKAIPGLENGAWLEKNIGTWFKLFTMKQKCLTVNLKKQSPEKENT